jgi:hypothetical protein
MVRPQLRHVALLVDEKVAPLILGWQLGTAANELSAMFALVKIKELEGRQGKCRKRWRKMFAETWRTYGDRHFIPHSAPAR